MWQFWIRQLLPTNFRFPCNVFVTLEKCIVCSANTGIVPEDFSNLILLTVTSNYHKTLTTTASLRGIYLHIGICRVLKYACCFAYVFILPSAEQFSHCFMMLWKAKLPQTVALNLIHTDLCGDYAPVHNFTLIRSQTACPVI